MRLILVFFLLIGLNFAHATPLQKPVVTPIVVPKKKQVLKNDTSTVILRKFDGQSVKNYSKQKEFIYDDVVPESQNLWDKFWIWVWRSINRVLANKIGGGVVKYILVALVIGIIVFIVIKLIGLDFRFFTGKSKTIEVPYQETLENIHEINFEEQIDKAIQDGNYRLVVRLLYLKTLKQLNDQNLINWLPEKTNQTYVSEIANEGIRRDFATLTNQFEYIWYGEFFIDKTSFEPIQQSFHQFNQRKI